MSIVPNRVTITNAATRLSVAAEVDFKVGAPSFIRTYGQSLLVRNRGSVSVFLGGPGVTSSTGFELEADGSVAVDMADTDDLYGVVASGSAVCHVLQSGV